MCTYATIVNKLSEVLLNIQLGVQEGFIKDPSYISIILPINANYKFKNSDKNLTKDRILWFIENIKPTSNGTIISIYISDKVQYLFDSHWNLNNLWISKKTWKGNGNYITVQFPEKDGKFWNQTKFYKNWEIIEKYLKLKNIEIRSISYQTDIKSVYDLLLNAKLHIGYIGSCYFISALVRTPTLGLGREPSQDPFIKQHRKNCWGTSCMAPNRVLQIDSTGKVYNGFVNGSIDTTNSEYIEKLISDVIEKNNYDEFWL